MKYLVTGGCGFIGSHFIKLVLQDQPEAEIGNIDKLTYAAHPDTPSELSALGGTRYKHFKADICDSEVETIVSSNKWDWIIHFAAESHVDRSILDPNAFLRTNVLGTQNLLNVARKLGNVPFIHVSTDEVYGSLNETDPQFTELSPLEPNSPYSATKASSDLIALAAAKTYGQKIIVTRCTNNYGPYQFPEKLIPLVITNALENLPVPVYGDGLQIRDWIHVSEHAKAILLLTQEGNFGDVYNISQNQEIANIEVVKRILNLLKKPHSLIQFVGDRPAHDRRYGLSSQKILSKTRWRPQISFESGLEETVNWYANHLHWWQKVKNKEFKHFYQSNYQTKFEEKGSKL